MIARQLIAMVGPRVGLLGFGAHPLGQVQDDVAQRVQGAWGLAVGGTTTDTHGGPYGLRPQGRPSPQDEALRGTILLGTSRKT